MYVVCWQVRADGLLISPEEDRYERRENPVCALCARRENDAATSCALLECHGRCKNAVGTSCERCT